MRPKTFRIRALLTLFAAIAIPFCAQAQSANIAATDVFIAGSSLALEDVTATTGVNIPVQIQTTFGGLKNEQAPKVPELAAVGELTGPGLATPITLTVDPGHAFTIPGLQAEGTYLLQNVRLMRGTTFVQNAVPSTAAITVADILKTKVSVRQLTAAELRARGITIDARNYDVYEYTLSFFIGTEEVLVPFPVIIDKRTHEVIPINKENKYTLPGFKGPQAPPRWAPPSITPMELGEGGGLPDPPEDEGGPPPSPRPTIPAAIIIPNSFGVLHQFFAVALSVTNNAPAGSSITLDSVTATMKNPAELRVADVKPAVSFGRPVPLVDPNTGTTILIAQAEAKADWTLEALKTGTHTFNIVVEATYRQSANSEPIALRGTATQQIVVHDPRFNVTFSHPDVVRAGLTYSTFTFVTNMTSSTQTVRLRTGDELPACSSAGGASVCRLDNDIESVPICSGNTAIDVCRPSDDLKSQELTLKPGATRTLVYKLRTSLTGNVFATAGSVDSDAIHASVQLHMGVSTSGIPLSPATLVMPYYAQYLDQQYVTDSLQLLGLGYSLATAPVNNVTAKFPRVITTDVFHRAIDIARAGQRIFIGEDKRDTFANLTLDLLGNGGGNKLVEWDQLRRAEYSGRISGAALGRQLEAVSLKTGGEFDTFVGRFGQTTAHRSPYFIAATYGAPVAGNSRPYAISLKGVTTHAVMDLPNELATEENLGTRDIAFGDLNKLTSGDNARTGELAAIGIWSENYELTVTPAAGSSFTLDLLYPSTAAARIRHLVISVSNASGKPLKAILDPNSSSVTLLEDGGSGSYSGNATEILPAPLAIIAAHQDMHLDGDGHKVAVLFNRPVDTTVDYKAKFGGKVVFNQGTISYTGPRGVDAAALQDDERTLYLTFDHSLSTNATYSLQIQPLIDTLSGAAVNFTDVVPVLENTRPAGIIYGRVLRGDNAPVPGAQVILTSTSNQYDTASAAKADFLFEYVLRDVANGVGGAYRLRAIDENGKTTFVDGAIRLTGIVETVNLVYLGRGSAEGRVTYDNGEVVPNAKVVVGSTLFNQFRTTTAGADGRYKVTDLPVGPLTFSAVDAAGNTTFAASEIRSAGEIVTQDLSIYRQPFPGTGTIRGIVIRSDTNQPVPNAHVGVYTQGYGLTDSYTDAFGRFEFQKVTTGLVTVLASEWSVSRKAIGIDFDLANDQVKDLTLTLEVNPGEPLANLEGDVEEEDPLSPGTYKKVPNALVQIKGAQVVTADANGHFVYTSIPLSFGGKEIKVYNPASKRAAASTVPTLDPATAAYVRIGIRVSDAFGTGTIQVRVLNAAGLPVSNYRVFEPGYPVTPLTAIGDGKYELRNVRVGSTINVWAVPTESSRATYGEQVANGNAVVAFNGQTSLTVLRLPGQGKLRVRLLTDIVSKGDVNIIYPKWDEAEQSMRMITVTKSTEDPITHEINYAVFEKVPVGNVSMYVSVADVGYGSANRQFVYDGQIIDVDLQAKKLASLSGVVYNIDGITPMPGVPVRMTDGVQLQGPQPTGLDGSFKFGNVAAGRGFNITAESTVNGIYRVGRADGVAPSNGGPLNNLSVTMKQQGSVEGFVVYSGYKVFDPNNPANNVVDPTPNDITDNARVPLAQFHLRELSYPYRSFGQYNAPLTADISGHFQINNVFAGAVRLEAWSQQNQDLRGVGQATLEQEGSTVSVYAAVGTQGFGPLVVNVVNPNKQNAPVENAEVALILPFVGVYDFGTTDANGTIRFEQVPARGGYSVDAFSKQVGLSGSVGNITVQPVSGASVLISLEFSGSVNGTLTDPEAANAGVPGIPVILTAQGYQQQTSTSGEAGKIGQFFIGGVHEGTFKLDALNETSRRRAHAQGAVSSANPNPTVNMELERTSSLYVKVFYPNDDGSQSNVEVPVSDIQAKQRCRPTLGGEICEYKRDLQGSGLVFTNMFLSDGYSVSAHEVGGDQRSVGGGGSFPVGSSASNPFKLTLPAFGSVQVTVTQPVNGVMKPAAGARVNVRGVEVTTDTSGVALAHGIPLGDFSVGAVSFDGSFSAYSPTVHLGSQTVTLQVALELGAYAGVSGIVNAETGGPSVNTRVIASFPGRLATVFTDSTGAYKFQGIPVSTAGPTNVSLTYYGPDDKTVGAAQSKALTAANASQIVKLPDVTLDATPPAVISVVPEDNAINVSPDSNIVLVFTEPILASTVTTGNFQLFATDGSPVVNVSFIRDVDGTTGRCTITMIPPQSNDPAQRFPLKSNMLYKVLLTSGIRDEQGHALTQRGFSFITADYIAPKVVQLDPQTNVPLSKSTTFNVRFNKPLASQLFSPTNTIVAPLEMHLFKLSGPGGNIVSELPGTAYGDQPRLILSFAPNEELEEKSYYRLTMLNVRDTLGNVADPISYDYFSYDKTAPFITFDAPVPPGTPVIVGVRYTLKTVLHDGTATGPIANDVARVDFFRVDNGQKTLLTSLTKAPFEYSFVPATATPATLTFRAESYDTSFNNATPQEITFDVAPNLPPQNVTLTLMTPDPIYAGTKVSAKPSLTDEGVLVTLQAQLTGTKTDGTAYTSAGISGQATRAKTTDPWSFNPATFDFTLPTSLQDGSTATITMTAADGVTSIVNAAPVTFTVAADANPPVFTSLTVSPASPYALNSKYTITAVVKDLETGISDVSFNYDGITTTIAVASATKLADGSYRFVTPQITVPAKNDDTRIAIVATAKDFRGNKSTSATEVTYIGVHDESLPKGAWVTPLANAAWPSDQAAFTTTLRVYAKDDQAITSVKFVVPGITDPVTATPAGGDIYTAQVTVITPAPGTAFEVTAQISDADTTHTQSLTIPITLVKIDTTLGPNFTQAITSTGDSLANKNVLVKGPNTHLVMHVPFTFKNLIVVDGASVETLPTTTSQERKLELTVTDTFYVDSTSIVDVIGRGYVGGWGPNQDGSGTRNNDSRGRTVGNTVTGGSNSGSAASHGGAGGENGGITNATYGSITEPRTLGAGGGGGATCCNAGGQGGGAVSIVGGNGASDLGRLIVAGSIKADGVTAFNSAGAGGSVRLNGKVMTFGRNARVTANGSDENASSTTSRGSGGGRLSIVASEQLDTEDTLPQFQARGGRNGGSEGKTYVDGGAGTMYFRRPGQQYGELVISSFDDRAPSTTHQSRPTILGYTGSGNSTAVTASTLTDSSRTFVSDAIGEELILGTDTTKSYTITAVSADGHTLTTDSTDGSLLDAGGISNGVIAYAGMLKFDVVRVIERGLARFDDSVAIDGVVDDTTKATIASPLAVMLLRNAYPAITLTTTPADGGDVIRGASFTATYNATSAAGIGNASFVLSPVAAPYVDSYTDYPTAASKTNRTLAVAQDTTVGAATLTLTATDRSGRKTTTPAVHLNIIENAAPTIDKFDVTPSSLALYAGHSIAVDAAATDDLAVSALTLTTTVGTLTSNTPVVNGKTTNRTFSVAVPATTHGNTSIDLTLSATDGFAGRTPTTQTKTVTVTLDPNPPTINVTGPAPNSTFEVSSTVKIPVRAVITDAEVAVDPATVFVSLGGATPIAMVADSTVPNGFKADLPVPSVDGTQAVQKSIVVTAKDYEGNSATTAPGFNVNIQPVFDPNGPVVAWVCPTSGSDAIYGSSYNVTARATAVGASSDNGITSVVYYVGDSTTPINATLTSGAYQATLPMPAVTQDTQVTLKVVATSIRGNVTTVTNTVTVVAGSVVNTATTINNGATQFENQTVIVTGAKLTIDGPHTFARLIVLDGGIVTHTPVANGGSGLKLTVTGATYISCTGTIDTTTGGYGLGQTYPGITASTIPSAGSHIGRGGNNSGTSGGTYGSIYRPQEAGAGANHTGWPTGGGGIVRLITGSLSVDGTILANGQSSMAAAGGSIWISTGRIVGTKGLIEASGTSGGWAAGGGGAIALEYTDATSTFPTMRAVTNNAQSTSLGGAGSVYLKGPSSTFGDFYFDNNGMSGMMSDLPSLGKGFALTGSTGATLVTDRSANIPAFFVGHWVEITAPDGTLKGAWKIATVVNKTATLAPNASETISVAVGDTWQGVYRFDNVFAKNGDPIRSTDPLRVGVNGVINLAGPTTAGKYLDIGNQLTGTNVTITGNVGLPTLNATNVTVKTNGALAPSSIGNSVTVNATGAVTIETNAAIDASSFGYGLGQTYPGATASSIISAGSHIGRGGNNSGTSGTTFGSIYRPQEAGGGANHSGYPTGGGGVVRINASNLTINGAVRANAMTSMAGAGGSVWITTGKISGTGNIETYGAWGGWATGGGGAIAVEYTDSSSTLPTMRSATSTPVGNNGGAGSIYVKSPSSTYGSLTVDNLGISGMATDLPSLGNGTALTGTSGATLVTDRSANIPAYFAGHWVEISTSAGVLKGTWRIATINNKTVTLTPNDTETISVAVGDKWQGVYRLDSLSTPTGATITGNDPIRVGGGNGNVVITGPTGANTLTLGYGVSGTDVTISGNVTLGGSIAATNSVTLNAGTITATGVSASSLLVKNGATLTTQLNGTTPNTLTVNVSGTMTVESGGIIDVTGRGYQSSAAYPGATLPGAGNGGSHIGIGGFWNSPLGSTFGSIYRPREAGGGTGGTYNGGHAYGGGILRINAGTLQHDGAIRANGGVLGDRAGAGGSVWITATDFNGNGTVDANGGDNPSVLGTGGGGAVTVEYTNSTGTVLTKLTARMGTPNGNNRPGAAGTVFVKSAAATYGAVTIDNKGYAAGQFTDFPSLGNGVALSGTTGATLVTDRSVNIPAYFEGHWVEISTSTGAPKGTWRISAINNKTATLTPNAGETISLQVGDKWQGVYRFDTLKAVNGESFRSIDPIRLGVDGVINIAGPTASGQYLTLADPVSGTNVTVTGNVALPAINATTLVVKSGALLTTLLDGINPVPLTLNLSGSITVENGGSIDVTNRGYQSSAAYPGATLPGAGNGGSHIGIGGFWNNPLGSTFGSIYRPREAGGGTGGTYNGGHAYGGGILRINTPLLQNDGVIRANGGVLGDRAGAGGSIWITATDFNGNGVVETNGGDNGSVLGTGAGGAISVEYTNSTGTILTKLSSRMGTPNGNNRSGAPGTVYLKTPAMTYGVVSVDNKGYAAGQNVDFPSLGNGIAQATSTGATVVTDKTANIPGYFEGHWVEISTSTGTPKGTWRIATIINKTFVLAPNGNETISVQPGDKWQGVYRFDTLNAPNGTTITGNDPVRFGVNGAVVINGPATATLDIPWSIDGTDVALSGNITAGGNITATNSVTLNPGTISATGVTAATLLVKNGSTLTTPINGTNPNPMTLNVSGSITVESGGAINVTGRGYQSSAAYPGATLPGAGNGGSHIGIGGFWNNPLGSTFGSIYRPREAGGGTGGTYNGGHAYGGGILRIITPLLQNEGAIRANGGVLGDRAGAGGSIWITATNFNGDGVVETNGGDNGSVLGVAGGGAISVEYTNSTGTILTKLTSRMGTPNGNNRPGAPGTVFLKTPAMTYGVVSVDNKSYAAGQNTDFPSLGNGTALTGSTGSTLVTDRSVNIPAFFEGHWIEISTSAGTLKGTWRIATINNKTVTLSANGSETIDVQPGDKWQGVYRFDTVTAPNGATITGNDPIRFGVNGTVVINGPATATLDMPYSVSGTDVTIGGNILFGGAITATNSATINPGTVSATGLTTATLLVKNGGTLTTPFNGTAPNPMTVNATTSITVESGGAIDVSSRGYQSTTAYPGATVPGAGNGGTHIGVGGFWNNPLGTSFGSVYRPREAGGGTGGTYNGGHAYGGGILRINTPLLQNDGSIRANGGVLGDRAGAGGSIWITATDFNGNGVVETNGGDNGSVLGSAGGGAISVEYTNSTGTILTKLSSRMGTPNGNNRPGAPGSYYVKSAAMTYGDLTVDNKGYVRGQFTELQALGIGIALTGTTGNTLVTDRSANIPAYFEGHWVNVTDAAGVVKGSWRIATINNKTVTLQPNGSETISLAAGDRWRGSYKFDHLTLKNCDFKTADLVELGTPVSSTSSTYLFGNVSAPVIDKTRITIQPTATGMSLVGTAGAVTDPDGQLFITATNTDTGATFNGTVSSDGSFALGVQGNSGNTITLKAKDSHTWPLESLPVTIGTLGSSTPVPTQINASTWTGDTQFAPRTVSIDGKNLVVGSIPWDSNGTTDKIAIVDISDPARPNLKRVVSTVWRVLDVKAVNGYAYVAGDRFGTINLDDPNASINLTTDVCGRDYSVAVSGGYAFTGEVDCNNDGRINVYDVSNPAAPRYLRQFGVAGFGGHAFTHLYTYGDDYLVGISGWGTGRDVMIINRRDVNNLWKVSELQVPNIGAFRAKIVGNKLYFVGVDATRLVVVDLSNVAAPVVSGTLTTLPAVGCGIDVVGNDVFIADLTSGLVTTTADPANLTVTGSIATGGRAFDVAVGNGYAYVANEAGVSVIPVSTAPVINAEKITLGFDGTSVTVTGIAGAVTGQSVHIKIADTTSSAFIDGITPATDGSFTTSLAAASGDAITLTATDAFNRVSGPVTLGTVPFGTAKTLVPIVNPNGDTDWRARTIKLEGNTLGLVTFPSESFGTSDKLVLYDVSNPASPVLKRVVSTVWRTLDFEIQGGYAFLAGDRFGTINVNDPNASINLTNDICGRDYSVAVSGGYAFTAEVDCNNDGRINVYDVSIPSAPRYTRQFGLAGFGGHAFTDLIAYGTDYLVAISSWGTGRDVMILNRRDVNNLYKVSELQIPGAIDGFRGKIVGNKLYLGSYWGGGVAIVDLSNVAAPTVVATTALSFTRGLDMTGNTLAVANGGSGVTFYDVTNNTFVMKGTQPTGGVAWDVVFGNGALYVAADQGLVVIPNVTAPPQVETDLITVGASSSTMATVTGAPGAVRGQTPLVTVLKDVKSDATISVSVNADGSFTASMPATPADPFTLTVTDNANRVTGPVPVGTMPFGTSVTMMPIVNPNGDTDWRARTMRIEGNNLGIVTFPSESFGTSDKLVLYDISSGTPVFKRTISTVWRTLDFEIQGGYAFVAGDRFGTVNLNDPNGQINLTADICGRDYSVAVSGGYAFTGEVDCNNDGRINIYDVTNPAAPRYLRQQGIAGFGGHAFTDLLAYGNDYLIALSSWGTGRDVMIIDRRDINNLRKVSELLIPNADNFRGRIVGNKLYAGSYWGGGAVIVDLTNVAAPVVMAQSSLPSAFSRGVDLSGNTLAVSSGAAGVTLFDVSNNTFTNLGVQPTGGVAWDVAFAGANLYVAADQGLVVIRNVSAPPKIDTHLINVGTDGTDALVHGNAGAITGVGSLSAEVKDAATGTSVTITVNADGSFDARFAATAGDPITVKATDAANRAAGPIVVGVVPFGTDVKLYPIVNPNGDTDWRARTLEIEGNNLAIAGFPDTFGNSDKLVIYDLATPNAPVLKRVASTVGRILDFEIQDGWAFVAGDRFGTINLNDNAAPVNLTNDLCGRDYSVAVNGGYAFTGEVDCNNDGRINIYDVSDPGSPRYIRQQGMAGFGGHAFTDLIALGSDYLIAISTWGTGRDVMIIDRRDVNNLRKVTELQIPQLDAYRGKLIGTKLYLGAYGAGGLVIVDVANPAAPSVINVSSGTPYFSKDVDLAGNILAAANGSEGVTFFDVSNNTFTRLGTQPTGGVVWDLAFQAGNLYVANDQGLVVIQNAATPPDIDTNMISLAAAAGSTTVTGDVRAIGGIGTTTVKLTNTKSGASVSGIAVASNGSFSGSITANPGDALTITATDAANRTSTRPLGTAPFFNVTSDFRASKDNDGMLARRVLTDGTRTAVMPARHISWYPGNSGYSWLHTIGGLTLFTGGTGVIQDAAISGKWVYSACDRLTSFDITQPVPSPNLANSDPCGREISVVAIGNYVYTGEADCNNDGRLHIWDVNNPAAPVLVTTTGGLAGTGGLTYHILLQLGTQYMVAITPDTGVRDVTVFNVSNPTSPSKIAQFDIPNFSAEVGVIDGNTLYVGNIGGGIAIVDLSNPASPVLKSTLGTPGLARGMAMVGTNELAVADASNGVTFIDVTDAVHPVLKGTQQVRGSVHDLKAVGKTLYIGSETRFQVAQRP